MRLLPIALAALLLAAAPASADDPPPLPGGVTCKQELKKTYRGLPFRITCDGPVKFFALPDFAAMTKASQDLIVAAANGTPYTARVEETSPDEAGSKTVRTRDDARGRQLLEPAGDWSRTVIVR